MRVAAIQMVSTADPSDNMARASELLDSARRQGADVALLPETFLTYGMKRVLSLAEQHSIISKIARLATDYGLWIVAGTLPLSPSVLEAYAEETLDVDNSQGDKPYAASLVFDPQGNIKGLYLKIHLFDVDVNDSHKSYRESRDYCSGSSVSAVDLPWCRLGLSVCYDLRFPELYTELVKRSCALITVPSAFTAHTGRAHWEVLLRARAIETQCYVVAANQGGVHANGRATWGESMVVNPWGEIVSKLGQGEGVLVADLDFSLVDKVRREMPIQAHRRLS